MEAFQRLFFNQGSIADFDLAFATDRQLLVKLLFYIRDKNRGLGLKALFCSAFVYMARLEPQMYKLLSFIPRYGCWKDLVLIADTDSSAVPLVATLFAKRFLADLKLMRSGKRISTAAKWYPSARSKRGRSPLTAAVQNILDTNEAGLRRGYLSPLRHYLDLVEIKMARHEWTQIRPERLSRGASTRYRTPLLRRDYSLKFRELRPRSLLQTVEAVLAGATNKVEHCWGKYSATITARGAAIVCDIRGSSPAYAITTALALGKAGIYTYDNPPALVTLPPAASLCAKVHRLLDIEREAELNWLSLPADYIIVVTEQPPPVTLLRDSEQHSKRIVWWQLGGLVELKQLGARVLIMRGTSEKLFTALLKGYFPHATTLINTALQAYNDIALS